MHKKSAHFLPEALKLYRCVPAVVGVDHIIACTRRDQMVSNNGCKVVFNHQLVIHLAYKYPCLLVLVCAKRKRITITPVFDRIGLKYLIPVLPGLWKQRDIGKQM